MSELSGLFGFYVIWFLMPELVTSMRCSTAALQPPIQLIIIIRKEMVVDESIE
ncbi:MAG: hypothetical protein OFPII_03080 [Osedax symbiont Rs1]|nr:MAG: hypothetical protein OFPII_03080 [Osedax symbiont Rs1]